MSGPYHEAHWVEGILGNGSWHVRMNGWKIVEDCPDQKSAQLRAAALNYKHRALPYGKLGLDGLED